eukprot:1159088-Pelagomonas_calceolata.AAC.8
MKLRIGNRQLLLASKKIASNWHPVPCQGQNHTRTANANHLGEACLRHSQRLTGLCARFGTKAQTNSGEFWKLNGNIWSGKQPETSC